MTELVPRLYGVVVPIDSKNFEKTPRNTLCYKDSLNNIHQHKFVSLQGMEILGTASEKEITFDCKPFILSDGDNMFKHYENTFGWFFRPNHSFMSLIKSKGIVLKPNEKLLLTHKK